MSVVPPSTTLLAAGPIVVSYDAEPFIANNFLWRPATWLPLDHDHVDIGLIMDARAKQRAVAGSNITFAAFAGASRSFPLQDSPSVPITECGIRIEWTYLHTIEAPTACGTRQSSSIHDNNT